MNRKISMQTGFTLVELVMVLAIAAVLITVGAPAMQEYLYNTRLTSQTNAMVSAFNYTRGQAVTMNEDVTITAKAGGDAGNEWGKGWEVWVPGRWVTGEDCGTLPSSPISRDDGCSNVLRDFSPEGKVTIDGPDDLADFNRAVTHDDIAGRSLGFASTGSVYIGQASVDLFLCDSREGENGRHLRVLRTGQIILEDNAHPCD